MNDLVKYQNKLNGLPLRTFEDSEMNILFSIIAQVRDKDLKEVTFTFDELREQCKYRPKSNITTQDFVNALEKTSDKLDKLSYKEITNGGLDIKKMTLFPTFDILGTQEKLVVGVHPEFKDIFNKLALGYTSFDLIEFISIQSIYAKTIYRMLKQFRTQGWWQVSIEDFRSLLSIPDSYKSGNIDQQILKPILTQLGGSGENAIFKNLKVEKIKKAGRGRGGVLTGYKFTFDKEKTTEWIENKYTEPTTKPKPTKSKVKKEKLPEWAENQAPAQPQKTYTETDFASVNDRIASLKSSGKEA